MARWHGIGLVVLLAGCSLDTDPRPIAFTTRAGTPTWSPTRRSTAQMNAGHAAPSMDAGSAKDAAPPPASDPKSADASHAQMDAAAPMAPPPATSPGEPNMVDSAAGPAKPSLPSAGEPAADGGKPAQTPGSPSSGGESGKGAESGRHSHKPSDEGKGSDNAKGGDDARGSDDKSSDKNKDGSQAATPSQDGGLVLLFTSISNLVYSILDFSFGPAKPANITNLIVSIVTLATLPASDVTTSTLTDLLNQLDDSNVCHDDHSACKELCETLIASCDLYKSDPQSVKSVERNCGAQALAACK